MISIIIPCYNSKKYMEKNINSLLSQTCKEFRVIFIDDGSSDNVERYIREKFEKHDIKFDIYVIEHRGVGYARNLGIKVSSTPYTMFLDADDYLLDNTVELFVNSIRNETADIILGEYMHEVSNKIVWKYEDAYKKISNRISGEELLSLIFDNLVHICTSNVIYKTDIIKKESFKENSLYHEDLNLYYKVIAKAKTITFIPQVLMAYVMREKSLSHDLSIEKLKQGIDMLQDLKDTFVNEGVSSIIIKKIDTKVIPNTCFLFFNKLCLSEANLIRVYEESGYFETMKHTKLENRSITSCVKYLRIKLIAYFPNVYKNIWKIYQETIKSLIRRQNS
ncbi:glycosyl transferase family 2 [Clostridium sp. DL-VIII]|uniref:glycosyltransferase family 2 protein n=1 Tax=Clostridium sp. DL-VIII TaxID=641107 RepID=UPI00023B0733|nr:glycosyltransferase family 2 protein [Clostridium sp. DL-VIII]EHJ02132.1 glycosyl transferase family 2 [Clostridium sp. DL-VIII]